MQRTEAQTFRENMPGLQTSSRRIFIAAEGNAYRGGLGFTRIRIESDSGFFPIMSDGRGIQLLALSHVP